MSILENYRREVGHLTEENALDMEFSKLTIDEEVRVTHGLFYTDEELEKTRQELLKVKLP